jgi:hypothetical protein
MIFPNPQNFIMSTRSPTAGDRGIPTREDGLPWVRIRMFLISLISLRSMKRMVSMVTKNPKWGV